MSVEQTFTNRLGFKATLVFNVVPVKRDEDQIVIAEEGEHEGYSYTVQYTNGGTDLRTDVLDSQDAVATRINHFIAVCKSNIRRGEVQYLPARVQYVDSEAGMEARPLFVRVTEAERPDAVALQY